MGWHIGMTAIKNSDSDRILDVVNELYQKYGLILVEERIGDRRGKYATSPKHYKDLIDYEKQGEKEVGGKSLEFITDFDFYENLNINRDWKVFVYFPGRAKLTVNINEDLASMLSKRLNTIVLEYYKYDVPNMVYIRSHIDGELVDIFNTSDLYVSRGGGFFERFGGREFESMDEVAKIEDSYLKQIGFNPDNEELHSNNEKMRRPMYLKGSPDKIREFLTNKQASF